MLIGQDIRHVENQKSIHTAWFNQCKESVFHTSRSIVFTWHPWLKLEPKTQVFLVNAFLLHILNILFLEAFHCNASIRSEPVPKHFAV